MVSCEDNMEGGGGLAVEVTNVSADPAFYEAQAVVLSNMGQHKQALTIIVFLMHDYGKAEE